MENKDNKKDNPANEKTSYHTAVLLKEVIDGLNIQPNGVYVDCTFGGGGHSKAILEKLDKEGRLLVFDQDADARQNLPADARVTFIQQNFRHLKRFLRLHKIEKVSGILADLGVSSHQFDEPARGFSTRFEAPLDMRMDERGSITATDILNKYKEADLHKLFEKFGEVTNAKTLARTIVEQRQVSPLRTINQLKQAVQKIVKGNPAKYFAQLFQALRIEVNDEIGSLKEMLEQSGEVLKKDGRIAVISFHSIEDRIVKNFFKHGSLEESEDENLFGRKNESPFLILTKKPVLASAGELKANPRARSAKLRIALKK